MGPRQQAPVQPTAPTPLPPPPDRSDADIQAAVAKQRSQFYGAGRRGRMDTSYTGGTGDSGASAISRFLGNPGR